MSSIDELIRAILIPHSAPPIIIYIDIPEDELISAPHCASITGIYGSDSIAVNDDLLLFGLRLTTIDISTAHCPINRNLRFPTLIPIGSFLLIDKHGIGVPLSINASNVLQYLSFNKDWERSFLRKRFEKESEEEREHLVDSLIGKRSHAVHYLYQCDNCGEGPIVGTRWSCPSCAFDLCDSCVGRVRHKHPLWEITEAPDFGTCAFEYLEKDFEKIEHMCCMLPGFQLAFVQEIEEMNHHLPLLAGGEYIIPPDYLILAEGLKEMVKRRDSYENWSRTIMFVHIGWHDVFEAKIFRRRPISDHYFISMIDSFAEEMKRKILNGERNQVMQQLQLIGAEPCIEVIEDDDNDDDEIFEVVTADAFCPA